MTRAVLATRNRGKLAELQRILAAQLGDSVELVSLDDVRGFPETVESGLTFEANALLKARDAAAATGLLAIADDSGLVVEVLGGMPGIFSARWAGRHGDDAANLALVLAQVADVPDEHRGAAFVCAAAAVHPDGRELVVHGRIEGVLVREPRGSNGFGYDPVFQPAGWELTTAELDSAAKDAISHRGRAFRALAEQLSPLLQPSR